MEFLTPVVNQLKRWYLYPRDYYLIFLHRIFVGIAGLLAFFSFVSLIRRAWISLTICMLIAIAMVGEYFVLQKQQSLGAIVTLAAPFLIALLSLKLPRSDRDRHTYAAPLKLTESAGLVLIFALLLCTQFYLLNYIPYGWDTESCPFRYLYWPSWPGLLLRESGHNPQNSAGLSWNLTMNLLGHTDEPDRYYLYMRFMRIGVAALKFIAFFFLARAVCGPFAAFFGAAVLGFSPPENW
jgi:hypothetical protein